MSIEILAHRGANDQAPENTLAAARLCVDQGADWLEIDVRGSKDGVLYNLHDRTVDRTTGGSGHGAIAELRSEYIDTLDAGGWFSAAYAGEPIPRVEAVVRELPDRIKIFFDVKDHRLRPLVDLVRTFRLEDRSMFWFWNNLTARRFHRLASDLLIKVNAGSPAGAARAHRSLHAGAIECGDASLNTEMVDTCRELGMKLVVRTETNDERVFRKIIDSGADIANVDYVQAFARVRDEANGRRDRNT